MYADTEGSTICLRSMTIYLYIMGEQMGTAAWEDTVHQAVSDAYEEEGLTPGGRKRATPGSRGIETSAH